jgi:hypothetical protein
MYRDKTDAALGDAFDPAPHRFADVEHLGVEKDAVLWRKGSMA